VILTAGTRPQPWHEDGKDLVEAAATPSATSFFLRAAVRWWLGVLAWVPASPVDHDQQGRFRSPRTRDGPTAHMKVSAG
jgi:hypothetical protein